MQFPSLYISEPVTSLLAAAPLNELEIGSPMKALEPQLLALSPETLVRQGSLRDHSLAVAALAGLWLRFEFYDKAHDLCNEVPNASGSYWHAILHRREPDFGNARYWLARVGPHPAEAAMLQRAQPLADPTLPPEILRFLGAATWNADQFVELARGAKRFSPAARSTLQAIQRIEWETLFEFCLTGAYPDDVAR